MKPDDSPQKTLTGQPYEKPELLPVEITAEEVLALGCKVSPGAPGTSPTGNCTALICSLTTGS